jgi:small-conductance mechanosensitive channel
VTCPRLALIALCLLFALPSVAEAQLSLPGLEADEDDGLDASDPASVLRATYGAAQQDLEDRLERRQAEFRWRLERLDGRRSDVAGQLQGWRERQAELQRRGRGPERQELLTELLLLARELDGVLLELEDAFEAQLRSLQEAAATTRRLAVEVDANPAFADGDLGSTEIDAEIRRVQELVAEREARRSELTVRREELVVLLAEHREALADARHAVYAGHALAPIEPPVLQVGPFGEVTAPVELVEPQLSPAERELLSLRGERDRLQAAIYERGAALDLKRLELVDLDLELVGLDRPLLEWFAASWAQRRGAVASREADGIFNVSASPFAPIGLVTAIEHTAHLVAEPAAAVGAARRALARPVGAAPVGPVLLALLVVGLLLLELDRRLYPLVLRAKPRTPGDQAALGVVRVTLPMAPVVVVCGGLLLADATSERLIPLVRFSALAPLLVGVVATMTLSLFPAQTGEAGTTSPRARRVALGGVLAAAVAGLVSAALPLFEYPPETLRLADAVFALFVLLAWLSILVHRDPLLALLGATGDPAEGVLRAGLRRSYQLLAFGPVVVFGLFAAGYANLAGLLIRGGLVTFAVLLLAPWVHHRLRRGAERLLGYPDGDGWLAVPPAFARTAYRSLAPLLLLAVGLASLALLASGWNYGGDVLGNLVGAVRYPLYEVGQSRITGLSLLMFGVTLAMAVLAQGWVRTVLERSVYPLYDLDEGMRATLGTLVRYAMLGVGVLIGLKVVGLSLRFLTVFAGVIGLAVGFGSQTFAANFMAGIMLLLGRRISVGDVIEVHGVIGRVVRISGYSTVVRTLDNLLVTVPNSRLLDESVTNWTVEDTSVRLSIPVGVAYGSDTALVKKLLEQAAREHPSVPLRPATIVRFDEFGDSALLFVLCPWVRDAEARFIIASELRFRIDELFRASGVEIAFPQSDVHLRGGEAAISLALDRGFEVRTEEGEVLKAPTQEER